MHLIDIGYGFFIMRFDVLKDYHHALIDGLWFVRDKYLHVQAWEADFIRTSPKSHIQRFGSDWNNYL